MLNKALAPICPVLLLSLLLLSCSWFQDDAPPPPPEPTRVVIELEAAGDINKNPQGRPSPLMIRVYQLRAYGAFEKTAFLNLYEDDQHALGGDLIKVEEVLLKPSEKRTLFYEPGDDTRAIGLVGLFRNYGLAQWRASAGVQPNKTTVVRAFISGREITIR